MVRSSIDQVLKLRRLVVALTIGMVLFGVTRIDQLRMDLLPEFAPTTVEVQTEALGLSAEEVEQFITVPLEQDLLNGVAFVEDIQSASLPGLSSIVMTFEPGTETLDARQVVAERLTQAVGAAGLPQVADLPQMLQPLSSTRRVALISMTSPTQSQIDQSVLARWVVSPRLMAVEGVANVSIWGFRDRQLQVLVDPNDLVEHDITLNEVVRTTGNALEVSGLTFLEASSPGTGGFIDTTNQRLHVFHEQAITSPVELAQVVVQDDDGQALFDNGEPLTLGSIANIVQDHQPLIGDARCGDSNCVLLVVEKFPNADTPTMAADINSALEALAPGLGDVEFDSSIYRPAVYIEESAANVSLAVLIGGALVILLLGLIEWRSAVVMASSAVASVTAAVLVLDARQVTLNVMVVAGLAAGLLVVVAGAVVISRAVIYRRASHGSEASTALLRRTFVDAIVPASSGATYAFLVALALLAPLTFLGGAAGAFFPHIASAYLLAVGAQLVVGLGVASAVGMLLTERLTELPAESRVAQRLRNRHGQFGSKNFAAAGRASIVFAVLILASVAVIPTLDIALTPDLAEREVLVNIDAPPGTSLPGIDVIASELVAELSAVTGVSNTTSQLGRAIRSDQITNVNHAEIWVNIAGDADYPSTVLAIQEIADRRADISAAISTYSDQRIREVFDQTRHDVAVRVYGDNIDVLRDSAAEVQAMLGTIDGIENPVVDIPAEEATIEINVDLERASALGIKPGDIRRSAAMLVSGITVGNLFERQKVFDVVVWGVPEIRSTLADVQNLPILLPDGGQVPLSELATVEVEPGLAVIRHESVQPFLDVTADITDANATAVATAVQAGVAAIPFELGYHATVLGGDDGQTTPAQMAGIVIAVLIATFLLLHAAIGSWRLAAISLLALPLAASGGVVAARLSGGEVGLGTVAGLIAVTTLGAQLAVTLMRRWQHRRKLGEQFDLGLVVAGSNDEVVGATFALVAAGLVTVPMAIMANAIGLEVIGPMAITAIGGLVTTALMAFLVLPAAYLKWGLLSDVDTESDDLYAVEILEVETAGRT